MSDVSQVEVSPTVFRLGRRRGVPSPARRLSLPARAAGEGCPLPLAVSFVRPSLHHPPHPRPDGRRIRRLPRRSRSRAQPPPLSPCGPRFLSFPPSAFHSHPAPSPPAARLAGGSALSLRAAPLHGAVRRGARPCAGTRRWRGCRDGRALATSPQKGRCHQETQGEGKESRRGGERRAQGRGRRRCGVAAKAGERAPAERRALSEGGARGRRMKIRKRGGGVRADGAEGSVRPDERRRGRKGGERARG